MYFDEDFKMTFLMASFMWVVYLVTNFVYTVWHEGVLNDEIVFTGIDYFLYKSVQYFSYAFFFFGVLLTILLIIVFISSLFRKK